MNFMKFMNLRLEWHKLEVELPGYNKMNEVPNIF